jgi:hypothetical protein
VPSIRDDGFGDGSVAESSVDSLVLRRFGSSFIIVGRTTGGSCSFFVSLKKWNQSLNKSMDDSIVFLIVCYDLYERCLWCRFRSVWWCVRYVTSNKKENVCETNRFLPKVVRSSNRRRHFYSVHFFRVGYSFGFYYGNKEQSVMSWYCRAGRVSTAVNIVRWDRALKCCFRANNVPLPIASRVGKRCLRHQNQLRWDSLSRGVSENIRTRAIFDYYQN